MGIFSEMECEPAGYRTIGDVDEGQRLDQQDGLRLFWFKVTDVDDHWYRLCGGCAACYASTGTREEQTSGTCHACDVVVQEIPTEGSKKGEHSVVLPLLDQKTSANDRTITTTLRRCPTQ